MASKASAGRQPQPPESQSPRPSLADRKTSSEYTITRQRKASSPAHACQQQQVISPRPLLPGSACRKPMTGSTPGLRSPRLGRRSFARQPSPAAASRSCTRRTCWI
uniref:Uncharacterized protein n=1 Tax=Triticum urartu TaxID=4572 RepID=A0A8R7P540_TRIUA